ncbi:MAG: histidine kinase [Prolixibacteraceae bacterium]
MKTLFSYIDFNKKTERVISHLVFWMASYFFFVVFYGRTSRDYQTTIIFVSLLFPLAIATTYLLIYYLIPRFLLQEQKALFFLLLAYLIIVTGWLSELISLFIFINIANYQVDSTAPITFDSISLIIGLYFVNLVAVAIKQVKRAFFMQQENTNLEQKKLETELKLKEAELKLLRAQIHPHFLFNTLNNLYGLALEKSDLAPDLVLRISDLLDYMLYKCGQPLVGLKNELIHLQNYIRIEQIRYGPELKLEFNIQGDPDALEIAPMLLLPFVENAFKHGTSKQANNPFVRISAKVQNEELFFRIENSKTNDSEKEENYTRGIGLKNVRKRLELLYPEKYKLDILSDETIFKVNFEIKLNRSVQNPEITIR